MPRKYPQRGQRAKTNKTKQLANQIRRSTGKGTAAIGGGSAAAGGGGG